MSPRVPEFVDPWRHADREKRLAGRVDLAALPRLSALLVDNQGSAEFELRFHRDNRRRATISGFVRAQLRLECQRCLEPMNHPVDASVNLAVIEVAAEAERLPEAYDPVLVTDERLRPLDLVEEELLLALPQVPKHSPEQCRIRTESGEQLDSAETDDERNNPFAVLAQLRSDS